MGEDPKSIWKGSFTGKTAVTIWAAGAGLFVVLASLAAAYYLPVSDMTRDRLLGVVIGIPICAAAYLLLCHVAPQSMRLMLSMARLMFWKHLRWTLFGLACFAVLIGLVYIEEDLRGWYAWNRGRSASCVRCSSPPTGTASWTRASRCWPR